MSTDDVDYAARAKAELGFSRWWLVVAAALAMGVVSPYQYVWSSIEGPLATALSIPVTRLGMVFTLFVVFQAGSQFPVGWWRDRHGPRELTMVAAVLAGGGYVGLAYASSVWTLYVLYSLGAIGVGIVYTIAVNTALKWFPDRSGITTGIGTMAFAGGAALFVPFVRAYATPEGYTLVLQTMGALIAVVIFAAALVLKDPPEGWADADSDGDGEETPGALTREYDSRQTLATWQFWLMYAMFVGASGAGLMVTAQVVSFADAVGMTTLTTTVSAMLLPIAAGVGRLVMGDVSDHFDRRRVLTASFVLSGVGILGIIYAARADMRILFVLAVMVSVFFWSPQYTLFPSIVGEYFGTKHSSTNYAMLYSGKIWGGVFGGAVTAWVVTKTSWPFAFELGAALAVGAGLAALFLRAPRE
ncbi:MAG: OFA family MFS transporter [Halanaeroarchaeum sp.]